MAKINVIYEAWYFDLDCGHSIPGGVAPDVQAIDDEADCPVCANNERQVKAARVEVLDLVKLTMNAIIKTHNDTKLRTGQMGNKAGEIKFALNIICENYQLKFDELIEATK